MDSRPRILITDRPIGGAAKEVVHATEENDGWVVGYENRTETKVTEQCMAETGDVYDAPVNKYLTIGCSCISPNDQRLQMLSQIVEEYQVDDIIDMILQVCRIYAVESPAIKCHMHRQHNIPHTVIETGYSISDVGQLSTCITASVEMLQGVAVTYSVGIDSGSIVTKGILLADDVITRRLLVLTPLHPVTAITKAWETLREGLETTPFLTLIGYGRQLVDFADKQVVKIFCHGLGARFPGLATRAVIDIGGQDSKVTQPNDDGNLCDFLMNDKCTVGTGYFLEVISRTLGIGVEQLDSITENVIPHVITSVYTASAESKVTGPCSADIAPRVTLAGMTSVMARRSVNSIARLSREAPILFTGGVSHYQRFTHMLESHPGIPVQTHPDVRFADAIDTTVTGQ